MDGNLPEFLFDPKVYIKPDRRYLVLDFETTAIEYGTAINPENELLLACWTVVDEKDGSVRHKFKWGSEYEQQELLADIKGVDFVVAQNAKFDLQWLYRCGAELRDILVWDTMLGEWVILGNQKSNKDLDSLAYKYGLPKKRDRVSKLIKLGVDPRDIPPTWLLDYCQHDVFITRGVFLKQVDILHQRDQLHVVLVRNLTCSVLADIEFNGMALDPNAVEEEYTRVVRRKTELEHELFELTGGINLDSPKQLGVYLYEKLGFAEPVDHRGKVIRTGSGLYATSAPLLATLEATTDEQREFLERYREYNKLGALLSKNLDFFQRVVTERGGQFYGQFNQGITATHRLSSSGRPILFGGEKKTKSVQFQNLPREYKKLFWAPEEDWLIAECDGAQLEFRVGADLGRDPIAIKEISEQVDIHSNTARAFVDAGDPGFLASPENERRQMAKPETFKPLYGGMGATDAQKAYCKFFKEKYKGIEATQRGWTLTVLDKKFLRTPMGMIYYWPDTKMSKRSGYISNTTSIYNYPVQGGATAEIIPIALIHFWHRSKGTRIVILNTIHDSIVAKVHKDDVALYEEIAKQSLTYDVFKYLTAVYKYDFVTPLGVGIKVAKNWGRSKEEKIFNVFPDGTEKVQIK